MGTRPFCSQILVSLSNVLEKPVSIFTCRTKRRFIKKIAEKLEIINLQLANKKETKRKLWKFLFLFICVILIIIFIGLVKIGNTYMEWDYNPELARHSQYGFL